jgi:hypothetical protein
VLALTLLDENLFLGGGKLYDLWKPELALVDRIM